MKNSIALGLILLLAGFAVPGYCAGQSGAALAEAMRLARHSDGFEARMNISVFKPDGQRTASFKMAVIGQAGDSGQRLLIRGISPDKVRNRHVAAERGPDGRIRAISYESAAVGEIVKFDASARLFDSGLVLWDMFGAWWNWPVQNMVETSQIAGRTCTVVNSQFDDAAPAIREAVSCVDTKARLSLQTQLFDHRHALVRTISVERLVRKETGAMAAKRLTVTEADGTVTEVEVYSGDEHYLISADTFAVLDSRRKSGKQGER